MLNIDKVTENGNTCKEVTEPVFCPENSFRVVKHGKVCPECHSKKCRINILKKQLNSI